MASPFISRQDLTDKLGVDVLNDAGALIAVDAACDVCRIVAEQTFTRGTSTDTFDGTGRDALILPELPVNGVSSVQVWQLGTGWTTAGTADYSVSRDGVLLATNTAGTATIGNSWPLGRQNVRVTYDHGYDVVPESVRMVALSVASRLVVQGPTMSESVGAASMRFAAEETALMPTERMILRKVRGR